MASSVLLLEEDLSCPICFEEYNLVEDDRMPKLLLCLHTVCFTCLENLISDDEIVRCPICRMEHEINEDLEELLDNDAVVTHIRSKQEEDNKKVALEIYWKEWLEKCSDEIPDEELRVNIQDLVRNSLTPLNGIAKHPSMPEQQDLQRRVKEKQVQQQQQQQQQQRTHQRLMEQPSQQQRQVRDQNFNWAEFLEVLSQYLIQLNEEYNNPPPATEGENRHANQHRQEAVENRQHQYRQGGHNQHSQEAGEVHQQHRQEAGEDRQQHGLVSGLQQLFEQVELENDDTSEEEENENHEQEQEQEEDDNDDVDDYDYDEDENYYYSYNHNGWENIFSNDIDDDNDEEEEDVYIIDSSDEEEEDEITVQEQPQQQQHQQQQQQNQSNQPSSTVGRKIFISWNTQNKFADTGLIREGFESIYGPVDTVDAYSGSDTCCCPYTILEFTNNVCFIDGEYKFGDQKFNARLCSGAQGKVFVARLPIGLQDEKITSYFMKFGNLCGFRRPFHNVTADPVTYCFLTFSEEESANAVLMWENHYIDGQRFIVKPHVDRY